MLHCCVWGSKRRTTSSSVAPDARSRVTSSIWPNPPRIVRATDVPPNASQDADPFSHSRRHRCRTLQVPMKKSKSVRPCCSCCLKVDSLTVVPPEYERHRPLPPLSMICRYLLSIEVDAAKIGPDWFDAHRNLSARP